MRLAAPWRQPGLPPAYLQWARDPAHRGRLFLSKTFVDAAPPWQGRRVMRFLTPLYWGPDRVFSGVLEFLIDPFFICEKVTPSVRSGQTGYAWIIDQDEIMLAHFEKDFVGHKALEIRLARNPKIVFRGLQELDDALLAGKEGVTEYVSGWHRQKWGDPQAGGLHPHQFQQGLDHGSDRTGGPGPQPLGRSRGGPGGRKSPARSRKCCTRSCSWRGSSLWWCCWPAAP